MRYFALAYGTLCYLVFLGTFLYAIAFVEIVFAPRSIDLGPASSLGEALAWNIALLGVFAVQHSLMARPAFKRLWTRIVPQPIERSTYVLFASGALILLFANWRPILAPVWTTTGALAIAIEIVSLLGWGLVLLSTFLISHFELFGLKQVWRNLKRASPENPVFRTPLIYGLVRHPIYLGFIIAFWAAPTMTMGHLLFAAATTAYILIGIQLEERDLVGMFGDVYRSYRRKVSMLLPLPPRADTQMDSPPKEQSSRAARAR